MNFVELISQYPKESALLITITSSSIGWLLRNFLQNFIEHKKYWTEQKTYYWKEKIESAKKASEFYLEYLNLLNLIIIQFKLYREGKIEHKLLIENFEKEVNFYSNKLKLFPHFEHHHINLFYNFNNENILKITNENQELIQNLHEILGYVNIESEKISDILEKIHNNYDSLVKIHTEYLNIIRKDLKEYINTNTLKWKICRK